MDRAKHVLVSDVKGGLVTAWLQGSGQW